MVSKSISKLEIVYYFFFHPDFVILCVFIINWGELEREKEPCTVSCCRLIVRRQSSIIIDAGRLCCCCFEAVIEFRVVIVLRHKS